MSIIKQKNLENVVIPVGGLGSRMFPLTLSTPKNLLAVGNKTLIQYAVEEAILCGAERIHMVCSPEHLEMYQNQFRATSKIKELLEKPGKDLLRHRVESITNVWERLNFIVQEQPLGLGHAVLQAKPYIDGTFGVILPDDLILEGIQPTALKQIWDSHSGGMSIAALEVSDEEVSSYGIYRLAEEFTPQSAKHLAIGMVEKPPLENAPSNLAAMGRYILEGSIMDILETTSKGAGGEIQLTDAIAKAVENGETLWATMYKGTRFDCGNMNGFAHAQYTVAGRLLGLH